MIIISVVVADVKEVIKEGAKIGLSLNVDKCELITHKDTQVDDDILRSFKRVELEAATLLGAPLFSGSVLDSTWDDRCTDLARTCDRLSSLRAEDALILLRSSFRPPRVMHLLRCSPSTNHPALSKFDDILKVSIQRITNCDFSDLQWIQASLPVCEGGLGIRRVASLALPAFSLQPQAPCHSKPTFCLHVLRQIIIFPVLFALMVISVWDRAGVLADKTLVESSFNSSYSRASFLAACAEHSGDWLFHLPRVGFI